MVILIDACHSGGVDAAPASGARQLRRNENNSFNVYAEKLFSGEGHALLTSSDVNEISQEGKKWGGGHGVFTWAILKGTNGVADINRDRVVTTGELFDFVSDKVRQQTNGRQSPRALARNDQGFSVSFDEEIIYVQTPVDPPQLFTSAKLNAGALSGDAL